MTARPVALERLLAVLLHYGTWLASAVIAVGLAAAPLGRSAGASIVTAGIALFILLPVSRVALMLAVFLRRGDYRFAAISALVLAVIAAGVALGAVSGGRI